MPKWRRFTLLFFNCMNEIPSLSTKQSPLIWFFSCLDCRRFVFFSNANTIEICDFQPLLTHIDVGALRFRFFLSYFLALFYVFLLAVYIEAITVFHIKWAIKKIEDFPACEEKK